MLRMIFHLVNFYHGHDGASEAIGYGKSLMVFHMLRMKFGDEYFQESFSIF